MDVIREAIQRRAQGGGGTPAVAQQTTPQGTLPTGGFNTPTTPPAPPQGETRLGNAPASPPGGQGNPVSPEGNVVGKLKQGAQFDDETKVVAKQLLSKLIGVL